MNGVWSIIRAFRLSIILYVLPPAVLWAEATGSGGWFGVTALLALVLLWGAMLDATFLGRGEDQRLGLVTNRDRRSPGAAVAARTIAAAASLALAVVLLVVSPLVGIGAAIGLVLLLLLGAIDGLARRRRRFFLSELLLPFATVLAPVAVVSIAVRDQEAAALLEAGVAPGPELVRQAAAAMPETAVAAGVLFALMLGAFVLLCLVRDAGVDAARGYLTTPTIMGREGASIILSAVQVGAVVVAAWGVGAGHWHWAAPAVVSVASIGASWCCASRAEGAAAVLWTLGQAVLAASVLASAA